MAHDRGKRQVQSYLLSIAGIIVFSIGSILYLTHQDYTHYVLDLEHEIIGQSRHVAQLTDNYFEKYIEIFKAVSKSDCIIEKDGDACSRMFARLNAAYEVVENFAAADSSGRFFASGQPYDRENPPSISALPLFTALNSGAASYVMNPHIGPISGEFVTGIVIPLHTDAGAFDGLIGVSLKLREIEALWGGALDRLSANILILDGNHNLLAATRPVYHLLNEGGLTPKLLVDALAQDGDGKVAAGDEVFKLHATPAGPGEWTVLALIPSRVPFSDYLEQRTHIKIGGELLALLIGLAVIGFIRDAGSRRRLRQTEEKLQASNLELRMVAALNQSEQRYRELFQNAPVGLWEEDFTAAVSEVERIRRSGVVDLNAYFDTHPEVLREIAAKVVVLDVNKAVLLMHQAASREQLLAGLGAIFNEKSYAIFKQMMIALAEGRDQIELQGELSTLGNEKRTIIARLFRLGSDHEFRRILIATSDITQLTLTEEALRRSQKMDAIGQITGGIAHDFNNILGIVIGNLELLKHQVAADEKSVRRVTTALGAAQRAADLTRQLLGFSRQQAQQSEPTDLNAAIDEMKSLITRSVTPAIQVKYRQSAHIWPVSINRGDFKDALLNLVLNARDAMPEGGQLTIQTVNRSVSDGPASDKSARYPGDVVAVKVSDTGCGIPADEIDHIFEPFYTTKPPGKGTGLGLSMVFGFAKRSKGEVSAASIPGQGTTITLLLPRAGPGKIETQPAETEERASQQISATVLVVDDEKDLVELAVSYLREAGYSVISAGSGSEALQRLEEHPEVDLLFTDIVMPGGMGGYELAEAVVHRYPGVKVLFTTGFARQAGWDPAKFPHSGLLRKPYGAAELLRRLRQLLSA